MASRPAATCWAVALASLACAGEASAQAQAGPKVFIYSCVLNGKRITRDRQIAECDQVEQKVMNSDGSPHHVIPPVMTESERQEREACDRELEADQVARREAARRERSLLQTFPDEATHRKSREKSLDDSRSAVRKSQERLEGLMTERTKLLIKAEFYPPGTQMPLQLKQDLDANDAAVTATRSLILNGEEEVKRITNRYDVELIRLKKLWTGAPLGSSYVSLPLSPGCSRSGRPGR